jgi:EPS-associated MarR family transcriptional regulator
VFNHERSNQTWTGRSRLQVKLDAVAMATHSNENMTEREEVDYRVLRALSADPEMSQRQLAQTAGVSLGAVNYCVRALAEKGLVKVKNFRASDNKLRYAYVLTPHGATAKGRLAIKFLHRKLVEYERLRAEIESVRNEIGID